MSNQIICVKIQSIEFLVELNESPLAANQDKTIELIHPNTRETSFYKTRYDRWFNFNLAWSAIKVGDEDLREFSLDDIEPKFDTPLGLSLSSFSSLNSVHSLSENSYISMSTHDYNVAPEIDSAPMSENLKIFQLEERFFEFIKNNFVAVNPPALNTCPQTSNFRPIPKNQFDISSSIYLTSKLLQKWKHRMKKSFYLRKFSDTYESQDQTSDQIVSFDNKLSKLDNSSLKARLKELAEKLRSTEEQNSGAETYKPKVFHNLHSCILHGCRQTQSSHLPVPVPNYNKKIYKSTPQLAESSVALTPPQSPVARRSKLPLAIKRPESQAFVGNGKAKCKKIFTTNAYWKI